MASNVNDGSGKREDGSVKLELVYQAIRKHDNMVVSWYRVDGDDVLLPRGERLGEGFSYPLDRRVQWNEQEFWAKVYPAPADSVNEAHS